MSYLLHHENRKLSLSPRLSRTTVNQLETLRRAFELDTREVVADILTRGIQDEFDRRMAGIGVLPALDVDFVEANLAQVG